MSPESRILRHLMDMGLSHTTAGERKDSAERQPVVAVCRRLPSCIALWFCDNGWGPAHLVGKHVMFVGLLVSLLTVVFGPALRLQVFGPAPPHKMLPPGLPLPWCFTNTKRHTIGVMADQHGMQVGTSEGSLLPQLLLLGLGQVHLLLGHAQLAVQLLHSLVLLLRSMDGMVSRT